MLEFAIAHEAAHQWWYAGVGSDQVLYPWQDEALAEYSTLLYYESLYGAQSFDSLYAARIRPATESLALQGVGVSQSLDRFESGAVYDALVYRKGAAMLHDLRARLGNEAFVGALRKYYAENLFTVAAPGDLLAAFGPGGRGPRAALAARGPALGARLLLRIGRVVIRGGAPLLFLRQERHGRGLGQRTGLPKAGEPASRDDEMILQGDVHRAQRVPNLQRDPEVIHGGAGYPRWGGCAPGSPSAPDAAAHRRPPRADTAASR